jgi:hypothetical protein
MVTRRARTMGSTGREERPIAVTITLALLVIAATANLAGAIASLLLLFEPAEAQVLFGAAVSDWFWALSAALFAALAVVYGYVIRAVLARDAGAGLAVSVLGLIGVGYSLLSVTHLYGWGVLVVSLGMMGANQAAIAQRYYRGHALSMRS